MSIEYHEEAVVDNKYLDRISDMAMALRLLGKPSPCPHNDDALVMSPNLPHMDNPQYQTSNSRKFPVLIFVPMKRL